MGDMWGECPKQEGVSHEEETEEKHVSETQGTRNMAQDQGQEQRTALASLAQ